MNDVSSPQAEPLAGDEARELVAQFRTTLDAIRTQVRRIIVGQDEVVEHLLLTMLVGGHCLITGMPGTAKTLLVRTLADALGLSFKRIQFTPDLMPTDVTGTDIIEEDPTTGRRRWTFVPGPLFAHVLLADEINRTPPKTQAALLEAMQERSVTVRGNTRNIEPPFFVLATQNPIELKAHPPERSSTVFCSTFCSTISARKTSGWSLIATPARCSFRPSTPARAPNRS
jgi:MoxR-like ATPase